MSKRVWTNEEEVTLWNFFEKKGINYQEMSELEPLKKKQRSPAQCKYKLQHLKKKKLQEEQEKQILSETSQAKLDSQHKTNDTVSPIAATEHQQQPSETESIDTTTDTFSVPSNRREEIKEYLQLFGYKPDSTALQFYIPGKFGGKKGFSGRTDYREKAKERYGGTTFVIVGKTHHPSIPSILTPPAGEKHGSGYVGYLSSASSSDKERIRHPHEVIPLDFTPDDLPYPDPWKKQFNSSAYLVAMHVPSAFAKYKNELLRNIKKVNPAVKEEWTWLKDVKQFGYYHKCEHETDTREQITQSR